MKKNYDIAIIGGGLTGLTAALAMSSLNYKIALVDPKPFSFDKKSFLDDRTTAISVGSVEFYKKIGVWLKLKKYACPIKKILVEETSSKIKSSFESNFEGASPMGYMIENKNMIKNLIELVRKSNNIIKYDYRLLDLSRYPDRVIINLEQKIIISAKLIIGADGKNSYMRKLSNIDFDYKDYKQKAFTFNVQHEKTHNNLAIEKFLEEGPLAMLPIIGNKKKHCSSVVWSCNYPEYFRYLGTKKKNIEDLIQNYFKNIYGKINIISKVNTWDLSLSHAKTYISHRLVLVGDSAHSIHPLAGQGFNLTIRGIKKIYDYAKLESNFSKDLGKKRYLLNYSKKHFLDASTLIFFTDKLNYLFSNSNFFLKGFRKTGLHLFSKSKLVNQVFKSYATRGSLFSSKDH